MRVLSQTQIKMYRRCPQQWKLKYVDGRPEEPKPFFNLGSAVHAALEVFHDGRVAGPAPVEAMVAAFEETFDPDAYPTEEERERRRADGLRMIREFHEKHAPGFRPALAIEKAVRFELDGIPLRGFIDRVDPLDDDRIRIVDYKTGRAFDIERVRTDIQLTLYQLAAEAAFGKDVASVTLYHVPTQTPFEVERHGPEQVEKLRTAAREVADGIEREAFEPTPGRHCRWCDFKPWCPAWADEYPENWEEEPLPPVPTHAEAAELADRYGRLKEDVSARETELSEIRSELERFFEETGERAISGDTHRVTATRREEVRFDHDDLRGVLEPRGLWERVLKPDWRAEAELYRDPSVPSDVQEALEKIVQESAGWIIRYSRREGS